MTARPLQESDIPILAAIAASSGFPYPDFSDPLIELVHVVVDSQDRPVIAVAAKRLVEVYLYVDPERSPVVKMDALKMAHSSMATSLRDIGYNNAEAFVPPDIASAFGRRLERTFRWVKNWQSWTIGF